MIAAGFLGAATGLACFALGALTCHIYRHIRSNR